MSDALIFIAIFLAIAVGYLLGRYATAFKSSLISLQKTSRFNPSYFEGLTFLLKDEADESIDRFISDMDVSAETLEIHLSLAALLRRKGEISRAVKVHENLLSSSHLSSADTQYVQLELARDYIHSGLLGRAEITLNTLVDQKSVALALQQDALKQLLEIHQSTKDWLKAIDVADRLTTQKFTGEPDGWRQAQAQFCCELAILACAQSDENNYSKWVKTALRYDAHCVRASLLQAQLDIQSDITHAAMATLKSIPGQNAQFASEMIIPLYECYRRLGRESDYIAELVQYLDSYRDVRALRLLFELSRETGDTRQSLSYLRRYLPDYPGLRAAAELCVALERVDRSQDLEKFMPVFECFLSEEALYGCVKCGFEGSQMHWLCPSCNSWASMLLR